MANAYDYGDGFRLTGTFTANSVNTDPTTITFQIKDPDGVIISYVYLTDVEVIKDSTGVYYMDITASQVGNWWYRIFGTGTVIAALEDVFNVKQSQFD